VTGFGNSMPKDDEEYRARIKAFADAGVSMAELGETIRRNMAAMNAALREGGYWTSISELMEAERARKADGR
jgi:hypothetical protein